MQYYYRLISRYFETGNLVFPVSIEIANTWQISRLNVGWGFVFPYDDSESYKKASYKK